MDDRVAQLVNYIDARGSVPSSRLAKEFGVSERTIRSYVNRANMTMGDAAHVSAKRGHGYELVISNQKLFDRLMHANGASRENVMPQTPKGRELYLLNDLLNRSDWITLDALSDVLYVSHKTISGDIKYVEEVLGRFDLSLARRPHYGIRVVGREVDRRLCLASLVINGENGISQTGARPDDAIVAEVSHCIEEVLQGEDVVLDTIARQSLVVHVVIAIKRIRQDCYIPMPSDSLDEVRKTREFVIAEHLADIISERFGILFPRQEIAYIAIHLASKETLDGTDTEGSIVISNDVWQTVTEMLDSVWEGFRFDFRNDLELRMNLARHIVPLSVRLHYRIPVKNPLLADIKHSFPLAYLMAIDSSGVLVRKYGSSLSEEETGYVALAFALALERQQTGLPKKNVLIVCSLGVGTARLLSAKIWKEFGPYVSNVDTCDATDLDKMDFTNIDYIFSTVPIGTALPVPVCQADLLLEDIGTENIRRILRRKGRNRGFESCFFEDLFFSHMTFSTSAEVITFLCNALEAHEKMSPRFSELVQEREGLARTAFGNGVAFPHPAHPVGERTVVAICLLDKPVDWDGIPVRAVFLFSITKDGGKAVREFDRGMASLLMNESAIFDLLADQRFATLLDLLEGIGNPTDDDDRCTSTPGAFPGT